MRCSQVEKIHPQFRQHVMQEQKTPIDGVKRLWQLGTQERTLQPGKRVCLKATIKLSWDQSGLFVVLEADPLKEETGIELIPEVVPTRMLLQNGERTPVSVRNITSQSA